MVAPKPTLAVSLSDLKHLFDATRNCRTPPVRQIVRALVRSNVDLIERVYYRTVIRQRGRDMSAMPAEIMPVETERVPAPPAKRQISTAQPQASTVQSQIATAQRQMSIVQQQDSAASTAQRQEGT